MGEAVKTARDAAVQFLCSMTIGRTEAAEERLAEAFEGYAAEVTAGQRRVVEASAESVRGAMAESKRLLAEHSGLVARIAELSQRLARWEEPEEVWRQDNLFASVETDETTGRRILVFRDDGCDGDVVAKLDRLDVKVLATKLAVACETVDFDPSKHAVEAAEPRERVAFVARRGDSPVEPDEAAEPACDALGYRPGSP